MELKKREEAAAAEQAARTDIGWGHQIRSYVLQPYQLVKDLRTGVTSGTPQEVLDGDLDPFMEAALAQRAYGGGPGQVEDVSKSSRADGAPSRAPSGEGRAAPEPYRLPVTPAGARPAGPAASSRRRPSSRPEAP